MLFHLTVLASLSSIALSSSADQYPSSVCLTKYDAAYLVNNYAQHVATSGQYNATIANRLIAEGATVTSQSVNALMGKTGAALDGVTFDGKQAILDSESNKPNALTVKVLEIDAVGCTAIGWRWRGIPPSGDSFRAISIFHAVRTKGIGWQIKTIYGEFNSLTYAQDLGANVTFPPR